MAYSEEVKKLAETLKNSGLAASMTDALERAQNMIGGKEPKEVPEIKEVPVEKRVDIGQTTLGEVGEKTVEEFTETDGELKKEEVFKNKSDVEQKKEESSSQKKVDYSIVPNSSSKARTKEKKIDLSDVFNVNK